MAESLGHAAQPQAAKTAKIRFGFYNEPFPVVGKTVGEVRKMVKGMWSVPTDSVGKKGKETLEDSYIIQEGDEIEFQRRTGEKG